MGRHVIVAGLGAKQVCRDCPRRVRAGRRRLGDRREESTSGHVCTGQARAANSVPH